MASSSRLGNQLAEAVTTLNRIGARCVLIGGLALAAHKVVRATQDVDLLTDGRHAYEIDVALLKIGYQCLHRSGDAGNYIRRAERLDLLYATRPAALKLLASAVERDTAFGPMRVISAEGLIGFKLQGWVNNPRRTQDLEDIRALIRANRETLDLAEVREYFRIFKHESLLDWILSEPA